MVKSIRLKVATSILGVSLVFSPTVGMIGDAHASTNTLSLETENQENKTKEETTIKMAKISSKEKKWLKGLGFSNSQIENMPAQTFNHINNQFAGVKGLNTTKNTEYYKYTITKKDGKFQGDWTRVNEDKALAAIEREKSSVLRTYSSDGLLRTYSSDTAPSGWITQTTSVTELSNGRYLAKNHYNWTSFPNVRFGEAIGISHGSNVDVISGSEFMQHYYEDYNGNRDYTYHYNADAKDEYGYAFKFNLPDAGSDYGGDYQGYMYYSFTQNFPNDNSGNIFGHYSHALSPSFGISIGYGILSITGANESDAIDTHVDVYY